MSTGKKKHQKMALKCSNTEAISTILKGKGSSTENARRTSINKQTAAPIDPYIAMKRKLHKELYGEKVDLDLKLIGTAAPPHHRPANVKYPHLKLNKNEKTKLSDQVHNYENFNASIILQHYPNGQVMRGELFNNKSAVHLPPREFIYKGYALLNVTDDYMQTAVNAFAILLEGTVTDVANLPPDYVLRSARTIAMIKITREKLAMLWTVIKGNRSTSQVTHQELEMYRPLFKYVNAREMGRLDLKNTRILNFIGTHAELNRHQVGVVASKYMQLNPAWSNASSLNHMNNLLCGVPVNFMRKIPSETYLQLSNQVFYHIRACDPLQRKFYLGMMTKTEALGNSYSWSARDVSRLGLLLAEVQGPQLAAINPEAMSGITAQVMKEIPAHSLEFLTDVQVQYLALKPLSIFARKMKAYTYQNSRACTCLTQWTDPFFLMVLLHKLL